MRASFEIRRAPIICGLALALACLSCRSRSVAALCEENFDQGEYAAALPSCEKRYAETKSDEDRYRVAVATFKKSTCPAGRPLLEAIPQGVHFVDVQVYLAYCDAVGDDEREKGLQRAQLALARAVADHYDEGVAKANTLLAQIYLSQASFDRAREAAEQALQLVLRHHETFHPDTTSNAYVSLMDLLLRLHDYEAAAAIIAQFRDYKDRLPRRSRAWMLHREATYFEEDGQYEYAGELLEELDALRVDEDRLKSQYAHYRPWLDYHRGRYGEAAGAAASLAEKFESELLQAYVAAAQGKLEEAEAHLKRAGNEEPPDKDFRWEHARAVAEVAELRGDVETAEKYYRDAIKYISSLRLAAPASVPFFVVSHRGPFEGLIALWAGQGRWRDVLKVLLLLDASNLLQVAAEAKGPQTISPLKETDLLPGGATSDPFAAAEAAVDAVIARWSEAGPLVIAVAPEPRIVGPIAKRPRAAYRIVVKGGEVTGAEIKGYARLEGKAAENAAAENAPAENAEVFVELAEALRGDPSDEEKGKRLAAALLPDVEGAEPLVLLGAGRLAKLPVAGLRDAAGQLLVSRRSLSKAVSLREGRAAPAYSEISVVLAANPKTAGQQAPAVASFQDDAEAAFQALVATAAPDRVKRFGLGTATLATRERLWEAKHADVFYLAAHVVDRDHQKAIRLDAPDGGGNDDVPAKELAAAGLAPRIAILASCGSGVASDEAGMGSVAAAFSKSGSQSIIATDRTVSDRQTQVLMSALFRQPDWKDAPARALGRVQQAAKDGPIDGVAIDEQVWGAFFVITRAPYVAAPQTASLLQPALAP